MSYLEKFTEDQRNLIVSLPYRTGLWVSESDESGGSDSAEAELRALENIITGYSEDFLKSEFVEEIMRATLARKDQWNAWAEALDSVPAQCREALEILGSHLNSREVLSFKQILMEIATAVALAYREEDDSQSSRDRMAAYVRHYISLFLARLKKEQDPPVETHINVSSAERQTLDQLSDILQIDFYGTPLKDMQAA